MGNCQRRCSRYYRHLIGFGSAHGSRRALRFGNALGDIELTEAGLTERKMSRHSSRSSGSFTDDDTFDCEKGLPSRKDPDDCGGDDHSDSGDSFYSAHSDPAGRRASTENRCGGSRNGSRRGSKDSSSCSSSCTGSKESPLVEEGNNGHRKSLLSRISSGAQDQFMKSLSGNYGSTPKSRNSNKVSHYMWLEELLQLIVDGSARGAAIDIAAGAKCSPVFVVAGACPNRLCSMQAVLYLCLDGGHEWKDHEKPRLDFWWVKPQKDDPQQFERKTINRNTFGQYRNEPGRSQEFYRPLVEKFVQGRDGSFVFGIDSVSGRAYVAEDCLGRPEERLLLYFVWQEDWSNPWSRKKYMRGKICYQKVCVGEQPQMEFFARRFEIRDDRILIAVSGEERVPSLLPPDEFQASASLPVHIGKH